MTTQLLAPPETLYTERGERWLFSGLAEDGRATYAPAQPVLVAHPHPPEAVTVTPLPAWAFATEGE